MPRDSIRAALVERLQGRIAKLRKGQHLLAQRGLQDDLLNRTITRIRTVLERME